MKTNRSLKEIKLNRVKCPEDKPPANNSFLQSSSQLGSPSNYNVDQLAHRLKHLPLEPKPRLRQDKSAQSQKNLEIPAITFQLTSPKQFNTLRSNDQENIQITPFDIPHKNNHLQHRPESRTVLAPLNKARQVIEQPKRPKILNKKHALTFFEEFKLGKVLGKGRFGNVYHAQHISSKMVYAVKQISLEKASPKLLERLFWEIKIQSFLNHKHCLDLYKCYKEGANLYLLVELGECSLFDVLREKKYFSEAETCGYIIQTILALMHLHEHGVIHRDLKPENIVLVNNVVKLADFGWSIYVGKNLKRKTFCGTLDYVSPEIVMGVEYDEMVDVWSVGVLCYELCTGHAPFESNRSREETYRKILNVELKFPKYLSADIKDFITRLLIKKPEDRMTLEEALKHRWLKKNMPK